MSVLAAVEASCSGSHTRTQPPSGAIVVDASGSYTGSVKTVAQGAAKLSDTTAEQTLFIFPGTYREQVAIPQLNGPLVVQGYTCNTMSYSANQVTITHSMAQKDLAANVQSPNVVASTLYLKSDSGVKVYNINVANTAGNVGQAVATYVDLADGAGLRVLGRVLLGLVALNHHLHGGLAHDVALGDAGLHPGHLRVRHVDLRVIRHQPTEGKALGSGAVSGVSRSLLSRVYAGLSVVLPAKVAMASGIAIAGGQAPSPGPPSVGALSSPEKKSRPAKSDRLVCPICTPSWFHLKFVYFERARVLSKRLFLPPTSSQNAVGWLPPNEAFWATMKSGVLRKSSNYEACTNCVLTISSSTTNSVHWVRHEAVL
ncbi:hypothetical protein ON010_g9152 [Phytophthora cinnamomi]|nr:hypothetical protein ON010_g9152 [Phytophthora cinnamomi]